MERVFQSASLHSNAYGFIVRRLVIELKSLVINHVPRLRYMVIRECYVVLLDSSGTSKGRSGPMGYGFAVYECGSLYSVATYIFGITHMLGKHYRDTGSWRKFVEALLWGFSWKSHGCEEPRIRRGIVKALEKSLVILLASKKKLAQALDFLASMFSQAFVAVVCDGGKEEVQCMDKLHRILSTRCVVDKHARYTIFLSLADYLAGIARYRVIVGHLVEYRERGLAIDTSKYRMYGIAYKRLCNRLRERVYEFI